MYSRAGVARGYECAKEAWEEVGRASNVRLPRANFTSSTTPTYGRLPMNGKGEDGGAGGAGPPIALKAGETRAFLIMTTRCVRFFFLLARPCDCTHGRSCALSVSRRAAASSAQAIERARAHTHPHMRAEHALASHAPEREGEIGVGEGQGSRGRETLDAKNKKALGNFDPQPHPYPPACTCLSLPSTSSPRLAIVESSCGRSTKVRGKLARSPSATR